MKCILCAFLLSVCSQCQAFEINHTNLIGKYVYFLFPKEQRKVADMFTLSYKDKENWNISFTMAF